MAKKIKENEVGLKILKNLRKIIRAVDLDSKKLSTESNLTSPQILTLSAIAQNGSMTLAEIAAAIHLSPSTMVGIIDRLETKNLVIRERSKQDRRQVFIKITAEGKKVAKKAPTPLQDKLVDKLNTLSENQQKNLVKGLEQLVEMLDAEKVKAAPILTAQTEPK